MKLLRELEVLSTSLKIKFSNTYQALFSGANLTSSRTYTLPNRNGTLADDTDLATKQATLVSGTNIKTINGDTIIGSGNLAISSTVTTYPLSSTNTAYVSTERNYIGAIGTSALGDFSLVFNALDPIFSFSDLVDNNVFLNSCDYSAHNTGLAEFNGGFVDAQLSVFDGITLNESFVTYLPCKMVNVATAVTVGVADGSEISIDNISSMLNFSGTKGGTANISVVNGGGLIVTTADASDGVFNLNIKNVSSTVEFGTDGSLVAGAVININIDSLESDMYFNACDFSGVTLNVYVKSSRSNAQVFFNSISINDSTSINIEGTFTSQGSGDVISLVGATNSGSIINRINIKNSYICGDASYCAISSNTNTLTGINIIGCTVIWKGSVNVFSCDLDDGIFFYNTITNQPTGDYDYLAQTKYIGYLTQDSALKTA